MEKFINFFQIAKNVGTAGQPTVDQFSDIAKAGYSTVVNLAMHDSDNAIPEEGIYRGEHLALLEVVLFQIYRLQ